MSTTTPALRELGIDARAWEFARSPSPINSYDNVQLVRIGGGLNPWRAGSAAWRFRQIVEWADIIHWYCKHPGFLWRGADRRFLQAVRKPGVVEWRGSDIRNPDIERMDNVVWQQVESVADLSPYGSAERSRSMQLLFAELGYETVVPPGMLQYVLPELRDCTHTVQRSTDLSRVHAAYPDPAEPNPLVVHAPSSRPIKGTEFVLRAVDSLRPDHQFRFGLLSGIAHAEALKRVGECDIFVDQLVLGDYGVAAIEAMARGKPVVCYLKPGIREVYPPELPIVNATPESLEGTLAELLANGSLRHELGVRGRLYAEAHHDPKGRALQLAQVYSSLRVG